MLVSGVQCKMKLEGRNYELRITNYEFEFIKLVLPRI